MNLLPVIVAAIVQLPADVHLIPGSFKPGTQPDGNSVIFDAPRGSIVVDTGRHPEHTQKILDYAAESGRPIRAIVNTHWHLDHIGGNRLIRAAHPGVHIYATNTLHDALGSFLGNYRKQLEDVIAKTSDPEQLKSYRAEISLIDSGPQLAPTDVLTRSVTKTIAGRRLRLNVGSYAVTAADVWVFDPKTRVVAAGDLVTLPAPFLDTACPSGWSAELQRIAATKFDVLIPGHGAPMHRRDFIAYQSAFDHLLACANSDRAKSVCVDQWIGDTRSLMPDADEKFTRALMNYYVDLLRDKPRIAKACAH